MSELKGKTPHGEMTIDQLAEIQPGMATIMEKVGRRFTQTFYAAKGGNWKLAAYHLNQLRGQFKIGKMTRPKYAGDLAEFDKLYLEPIFKAIHAQDWGEFEKAFRKGEAATDVYHDRRGYPQIRYVLPQREPESDLYQGPPEKFRRN